MHVGRCSRCDCTEPPRPLVIGDHVPSNRRPPPTPGVVNSQRAHVSAEENLPSASMVHMPMQFRGRMAGIMAATLGEMVGGCARASDLERARCKLLLGPIPKHRTTRTELRDRLRSRAEVQHAARTTARKAGRQHGISMRAQRAAALARSGAYRKAVASLTSECADLSLEEQSMWASRLLPSSNRPDEALAAPSAPAVAENVDTEQANDTTSRVGARRALEGVRFAALSAPGPSGARPEHLQDALSSRPRGPSNRLRTAIAELQTKTAAGDLPACARWILGSRLVFLKKKKGTAPRPIRVGELWRREVAKSLVSKARSEFQSLLINARQFGVLAPGGADALVHFRCCAEAAAAASARPIAVIDVDLCNAFPSLEWDAIRTAVAKHVPSLLAWVMWCHEAGASVDLPSGGVYDVDRGAEQGDPLGSLMCALVLVDVVARTKERLNADDCEFFDAWYIDDGQLFCEPGRVDLVLRTLDEELAAVGATQGAIDGDVDVKSSVRIVGLPEAVRDVGCGWQTEYICNTCKLPNAEAGGHVLGVDFGHAASVTDEQFSDTALKAKAVQEAIGLIGDAGIEVLLTRRCADVCKVTHLLRAIGPDLGEAVLDDHDAQVRSAFERALGGPVHDEAYVQATLRSRRWTRPSASRRCRRACVLGVDSHGATLRRESSQSTRHVRLGRCRRS